jgi:hypothetical protein
MEVLPKGLRPIQYRLAGTTPSSTRCLYFPFWAFDVQIRTSAGSFTRLWDWLESTSRQALGAEWRETDPAQARLFLPARPLLGTPELDDAFSDLVAWASWRQPELIADRTSAVEGAEMLGAELEAEQARGLARYALPALHDRQSTRSLSGMTFRSAIGDAEIQLGSPELVCVPLELEGNRWTPGSPLRGASESLLRTDADAPRLTRSFNLPT